MSSGNHGEISGVIGCEVLGEEGGGGLVPVSPTEPALGCVHECVWRLIVMRKHAKWKNQTEMIHTVPFKVVRLCSRCELESIPSGSVSSPSRRRSGLRNVCPPPLTPVCDLTLPLLVSRRLPLSCRTCSVSDLSVSIASGIKGLIHQVEQLFPDSAEDSVEPVQHRAE